MESAKNGVGGGDARQGMCCCCYGVALPHGVPCCPVMHRSSPQITVIPVAYRSATVTLSHVALSRHIHRPHTHLRTASMVLAATRFPVTARMP